MTYKLKVVITLTDKTIADKVYDMADNFSKDLVHEYGQRVKAELSEVKA